MNLPARDKNGTGFVYWFEPARRTILPPCFWAPPKEHAAETGFAGFRVVVSNWKGQRKGIALRYFFSSQITYFLTSGGVS